LSQRTYSEFVLGLPFWLPFAAITIPTALLSWRDRRRCLPNHCQSCNYNLTGNTSGTCPECGAPISKDDKEPEPASDSSKE
jgi:predicted amidophosphoribosyltransferase